ncbi:MAG TPA: hypothetical protein VKZ18_00200 [Polyangia bacterium]|nr:hypothetical protein [Polyangia bacterium]
MSIPTSGSRGLLLGRLVDLSTLEVVKTLVAVPDEEITDASAGVGIVKLSNNDIGAFDLATGEALWVQTPYAPCGRLQLAGPRVYAACGSKLLAYEVEDGAMTVVDPGPTHALDPVVSGNVAFSLHEHDRLNVHDLATGRRVASKVVPELERAFRQYIIADPSGSGACVLGIVVGPNDTWTYKAACYDETLTRRWSKSLKRAASSLDDVRQLGPRHLVLDDQRPSDEGSPPMSGRGIVLRWRDGLVTAFDDATFATFEDLRGDRIRPDIDVFRLTRDLDGDHDLFAYNQATIVNDDERAFALIMNGGTGLAGLDRGTGRALFTVPVPLSGLHWDIGLVGRYPVVRTKFAMAWVLTVHDPLSGEVLYRDARPWSPPAWRAPVLMPPRSERR